MSTISIKQWTDSEIEADRRMKETKGHTFIHILKTRCQYCGRSPAQARGNCRGWFHTYRNNLMQELIRIGAIDTTKQ